MFEKQPMDDYQKPASSQLDVLIEEEEKSFCELDRRIEEKTFSGFLRHRHRNRRTAICLSGGGIRSATFSLGVLQGLAKKGDLPKLHYLSTVSGGGFTGSWLSRWIHEEKKSLSESSEFSAIEKISNELSDQQNESNAIRHLRAYSSYLAPKRGLSKDSATLASIILRNLALNWLILLPMIMAILVLPKLYVLLVGYSLQNSVGMLSLGLYESAGHVLFFTSFLVLGLAQNWAPKPWFKLPFSTSNIRIPTSVALGIFTATFSLCPVYSTFISEQIMSFGIFSDQLRQILVGIFGVPVLLFLTVLVNGFVQGVASFSRSVDEIQRERSATRNARLIIIAIGWLVLFSATLILPFLFIKLLDLSPAWVASIGGLGGIVAITVGFFDSESGSQKASPSNWLSLLSNNLKSVGALIVIFCILFLMNLANSYNPLFNKPQITEAIYAKEQPALFVDCLSVEKAKKQEDVDEIVHEEACTRFEGRLRKLESHFINYFTHKTELELVPLRIGETSVLFKAKLPAVLATALGILSLILVAMALSRILGINKFSLHALYGNRLVRAYLGAARLTNNNVQRDPETGFSAADNIKFKALKDNSLLHIVNATLNDTVGSDLARQQRKGTSFTFSPFHVGSEVTGYRDSSKFTDGGVSLGKAMTISGAAVSSSMGYHSSKLVSAVLTFLNARLGWWLPNPGIRDSEILKRDEPKWGVTKLLTELRGKPSSKSKYVHLSDGGHFDNLGLYEMVRRRCKSIVLVDASRDENFEYKDLSNVIRMIRVDFGIEIEFDPNSGPRIGEKPNSHHFRARIRYGDVDKDSVGKTNGSLDGVLIYIKPVLLSGKYLDLLDYAQSGGSSGRGNFPHDSTTDQFFDESQFESYRKLGRLSVMSIPGSVLKLDRPQSRSSESFDLPELLHPERENLTPGVLPAFTDVTKFFSDASNWVAPVVASSVTAATVYATVELTPPKEGIPLTVPKEKIYVHQEEAFKTDPPQKPIELTLPTGCSLTPGEENTYECGSLKVTNVNIPLDDDSRRLLKNGVTLNLEDPNKVLAGLKTTVGLNLPKGCDFDGASQTYKCGQILMQGEMGLDLPLQESLSTLSSSQAELASTLSSLAKEDGLKFNETQLRRLENLELQGGTITLETNSLERIKELINRLPRSPISQQLENIITNTSHLKSIDDSVREGFPGLRNDASQGGD